MNESFFIFFVCFLYLIFDRINVFNRGRIAQSVKPLTAECEVAGSFLGAGPLLRVLKQLRNEGTLFARLVGDVNSPQLALSC